MPPTATAAVPSLGPATSTAQRTTVAAAITALGIVYGDLGTSPLYTLQTIVEIARRRSSLHHVALGVLSLIFWALIITISIKYCLFVMRADNHGEGGILALMSLVGADRSSRGRRLVIMRPARRGADLRRRHHHAGDLGAERARGRQRRDQRFQAATSCRWRSRYWSRCSRFSSRGTAAIGRLSGPVMLLWFIVIAALGVGGIVASSGRAARRSIRVYAIALPRACAAGPASRCSAACFCASPAARRSTPTWATSAASDPHDLVRDRAAGADAELCGPDRAPARASGHHRATRSSSSLPTGRSIRWSCWRPSRRSSRARRSSPARSR